jgi:hypothetical protein
MKRVLKMVGGFVAAVALVCVLGTSAQARTFGWFSLGFPAYHAPAYYSGYCNPYPYARPPYRYYCAPPVCYYSGGCWYRR